ncbi:MAG: hypothetical protein JXR91_11895, partial [Deltaproteobacteria bacterium]|nr:hypothetical protein [Deltaproteobacteria bacterium]
MINKHFSQILVKLFFLIFIISCGNNNDAPSKIPDKVLNNQNLPNKKRILYVDSYDETYPWVQGITRGIQGVLNGQQKNWNKNEIKKYDIELKIIHLDSKRNQSPEFIGKAAQNAKNLIDEWKPDVVIASDDNASKYLIVPFFKNSSIPFVFCGINWDASEYGFPFKNVTGMIEVQLIERIIEELKNYGKGKKIGFIKGDSLSSRKEGEQFEKYLNKKINKKFVNNFADWKREYIEIQNEVDILLVGNLDGIPGWDQNA